MVGAIQKCTDQKPTVLGKPNPFVIEYLEERDGIKRDRTLMIGDRFDTDILLGKNAGIDTCLVMTGVTTPELLELELSKPDPIVPTYICKDLSIP